MADKKDKDAFDKKDAMPMVDEGKLFIGSLNFASTDESLQYYFSQWGRLIDFIVMKDALTKRSRGFGFVTFADPNDAKAALACAPHFIDGQMVEARLAAPRSTTVSTRLLLRKGKNPVPEKDRRIFVNGLKPTHTEPIIREFFEKFGAVFKVTMPVHFESGDRRNFAYVIFENKDALDKVLEQDQYCIGGVMCEVKPALPKETSLLQLQLNQDRGDRRERSHGVERSFNQAPNRPTARVQPVPLNTIGNASTSSKPSYIGPQSMPSNYNTPQTACEQGSFNQSYYSDQSSYYSMAYPPQYPPGFTYPYPAPPLPTSTNASLDNLQTSYTSAAASETSQPTSTWQPPPPPPPSDSLQACVSAVPFTTTAPAATGWPSTTASTTPAPTQPVWAPWPQYPYNPPQMPM